VFIAFLSHTLCTVDHNRTMRIKTLCLWNEIGGTSHDYLAQAAWLWALTPKRQHRCLGPDRGVDHRKWLDRGIARSRVKARVTAERQAMTEPQFNRTLRIAISAQRGPAAAYRLLSRRDCPVGSTTKPL
jgi:hypothetical protein